MSQPTPTELAGTPYDGSGLLRPPAEAVGLSALRVLANGDPRSYSAVEFEQGWWGVERFIRTLRACGLIQPSSSSPDRGYAVLDVLDAQGDIIGDYELPTVEAFRYVKRKLNLTVVDVDEEVAAYAAAQEEADAGAPQEPTGIRGVEDGDQVAITAELDDLIRLNSAQGLPYATATLRTADGTFPVEIPPRIYSRVGGLLVDAPLVITGIVDRRGDTDLLSVRDVEPIGGADA